MISTGRRINDFDNFMNPNQFVSPRQAPLNNIQNYHSNQERHQYPYKHSALPIASVTLASLWSAQFDPQGLRHKLPGLTARNGSARMKHIPKRRPIFTFELKGMTCTTVRSVPLKLPVKALQSKESNHSQTFKAKRAELFHTIPSIWVTNAITSSQIYSKALWLSKTNTKSSRPEKWATIIKDKRKCWTVSMTNWWLWFREWEGTISMTFRSNVKKMNK